MKKIIPTLDTSTNVIYDTDSILKYVIEHYIDKLYKTTYLHDDSIYTLSEDMKYYNNKNKLYSTIEEHITTILSNYLIPENIDVIVDSKDIDTNRISIYIEVKYRDEYNSVYTYTTESSRSIT